MYVYELERAEHLRDWLALRYNVFQPVHDATGNGSWQPLKSGEVTPFDQELRPVMSPKSLFFAEREMLFEFDGEQFKTTRPKSEPRVLFGVKACDLAAIAYQDAHFKEDPYYQARRKDTLLVGIDCSAPCDNGFCSTVDAGPHVGEGLADLILTPMPSIGGDQPGWWLICSSPAGQAAVSGMNLSPADSHWSYWRKMNAEHARAAFEDDTLLSMVFSGLMPVLYLIGYGIVWLNSVLVVQAVVKPARLAVVMPLVIIRPRQAIPGSGFMIPV